MILSGDIESARSLVKEKFPSLYESSPRVQSYLDVLSFINYISVGNLAQAVTYAENLDKYVYDDRRYLIPSRNKSGKDIKIEVKDVLMLLCYPEPEQSELSFLVSLSQRQMIADRLNNEILSKFPLYLYLYHSLSFYLFISLCHS